KFGTVLIVCTQVLNTKIPGRSIGRRVAAVSLPFINPTPRTLDPGDLSLRINVTPTAAISSAIDGFPGSGANIALSAGPGFTRLAHGSSCWAISILSACSSGVNLNP